MIKKTERFVCYYSFKCNEIRNYCNLNPQNSKKLEKIIQKLQNSKKNRSKTKCNENCTNWCKSAWRLRIHWALIESIQVNSTWRNSIEFEFQWANDQLNEQVQMAWMKTIPFVMQFDAYQTVKCHHILYNLMRKHLKTSHKCVFSGNCNRHNELKYDRHSDLRS